MKYLPLLLLISNLALASSKHDDITFIALAMYYEARSEGYEGMRGVGEVILVRVDSWRWDDTVEEVVFQPSNDPNRPEGCAFSFTCSGSLDRDEWEFDKWEEAVMIATELVEGGMHYSITMLADHYIRCDTKSREDWESKMEFMVRLNNHCYYKGRHIF